MLKVYYPFEIFFLKNLKKIFGRLKKSLYLCNALGNDAVP